MYLFAYLLLSASFLFAVFYAGAALVQILQNRELGILPWAKSAHTTLTGCMTLSSAILLYAFISKDFSVKYVAQYSDVTLPLFYRITAFWAGQAGSMLFWAWSVAIGGAIFPFLPAYKKLTAQTQLWFWILFFSTMAFFLLILTVWSNPFTTFSSPQPDGNGLNPLLQNPGMIFHPPLLFLGYGGFVIPGCLALAQALSGTLTARTQEAAWGDVTRPFILIAWSLLTAGIILGAWWAYMELGWGGYWAWDPVENASLIPWLVATAYLHTAVVESRRNKLRRTNVFLMSLTTISAFFATYLVRSGVVESLHAFGDGGVGTPLLIFTLGSLALAFFVSLSSREISQPLADIFSKEGLLVLLAWLMLALSVIILIATMWPVVITGAQKFTAAFSLNWSFLPSKPMGLDPAFYNRTCLPLFTIVAFLLVICPQLKWREGIADKASFVTVLLVFCITVAGLWWADLRLPTATAAAAAALAGLCGILLLFGRTTALLHIKTTLAAHGVHVGLLLMVLGVAFSGPYQVKQDLTLKQGQTARVDEYTFHLKEIYEGEYGLDAQGRSNYQYLELELLVSENGKHLGTLAPQRRLYSNFEKQTFTEVGTLFSLGKEVYATLASLDEEGNAHITIHINPLVNWLWIGGTLMCLFPFLGLSRAGRARDSDDETTGDSSTETAPSKSPQ